MMCCAALLEHGRGHGVFACNRVYSVDCFAGLLTERLGALPLLSLAGPGAVSAAQSGYSGRTAGVPQGEREPGERGRFGAGDL